VYILVLGASTMIAVVGIGAVALSRSSVRATVAGSEWSEAGIAAQSGVEYMVAVMNSSSTWRSDLKSGKPYGPFAIGRAKVAVTVVDEVDNDLSDDIAESVRVYAVATINSSTRTYSALVQPASTVGYDVLRCAVHAAGDITISGNAVSSLGPISCNAKVSNSVQPTVDIETSTLSSTGFITGYVQTGVTAKTMPGNTAMSSLSAVATTIAYSATGGAIDKEVLTPTLNTISGTTNASGVYAISVPLLSTLRIKRSRLQASLVVTLGASAQLIVQDENLWDPAAPNLPALIVQGALLSSVTLGGSSTAGPLSESTVATNYNRAGAPYNGITDSDTTDTYPSELHGLYHIYSAIPLTINSNLKTIGCIIAGGTVTISTAAQLAANPTLLSSPPSGYADPVNSTMRVAPGTYRWEVADVNPVTP
jgi:hypothetical protein